jgi:hypothetical protein
MQVSVEDAKYIFTLLCDVDKFPNGELTPAGREQFRAGLISKFGLDSATRIEAEGIEVGLPAHVTSSPLVQDIIKRSRN